MKLLKAFRLFWFDHGVLRCSLAPALFGGGGPSSTTSNVTQSSIPNWLRPQTEAMLGAATQQLFTTEPGAGGKQNITGIKGYVPYSANPADYVAGFSPMQQQSFQSAQALQTPGQFAPASGIATLSGMGGLQSAQQSTGLGMMGVGAGGGLESTLTSPYAMQQYMNPYVEAALSPQLSMMEQSAGRQMAQVKGEAARAGAYGGSRQAIQNALVQQGLLGQQANLIGQGYNQAYQQAQNAAQAANAQRLQGIGLGLQGIQGAQAGYGLGTQAATALGNLGGQELAANQSIIGLQNQMGQQQQAQEQQIINQAVQNYANAQQYPMQQLGMYNALLRGYATPTSASTQYTTVSPTAQMQGLGIAGLGALGASGAFKAKGGKINKPKKGSGLSDIAIAKALEGVDND